MDPRGAHVVFITRKWPPAVGGMEIYSKRLVDELSQRLAVTLFALPGRPDGRPPSALKLVQFGLTTAARLMRGRAPTVIHAGDVASWPLAWIGSLRHPGSLVVLSAHGSDVSYGQRSGVRARLYAAYVRLAARLLPNALVIANSKWVAQLAAGYGFKRVEVVPLGTDLASNQASTPRRDLLFAGRVTSSKGIPFLIQEVLPLVPEPIRLRVAGAIWDEAARAALNHPRVDYLGALSPEQLLEEYAGALCTLIPSQAPEGFGLVAIEAGGCGSPVVASNHSGLAEVVAPEIGYLVDAQDSRVWAEAVALIASWTDAERAAHASRAKAHINARHSWRRVAEQTEKLYGLKRR
jgi:glycosyltransferase involved in cell wall biosynthesis